MEADVNGAIAAGLAAAGARDAQRAAALVVRHARIAVGAALHGAAAGTVVSAVAAAALGGVEADVAVGRSEPGHDAADAGVALACCPLMAHPQGPSPAVFPLDSGPINIVIFYRI